MITGFHSIIYSDDAEATRAFFRNVLGWPHVDAGHGWLIFKTKPGELGIHPTTSDSGERWASIPHCQASLMCDDIEATIAELTAKGVEFEGSVEDQGFGRVIHLIVPAAGAMMLYQPQHPLAYELDAP